MSDAQCIKSYQFCDAVANQPNKILSALKPGCRWQDIHSELNLASPWVQPEIKHLNSYQKKQFVRDCLQQSQAMLHHAHTTKAGLEERERNGISSLCQSLRS